MNDPERFHPDEATLIAWLDDPTIVDPATERHVAGCAACAETVEELRRLFDELAAGPPMPEPESLARSRRRILAAVGAGEGAAVRSRRGWRRGWWVPTLAAAALAAVLLWSPRDVEQRAPAGDVGAEALVETDGPDPVTIEAERAAEAVVAAVAGEAADSVAVTPGGFALDEEGVTLLAAMETATPSLTEDDDYTLLAERFAALSAEDQAEILDELSDTRFEP
ncbi:MAG: hypothetical protein KY397_06390 [Gemmatimonadetes bacterium]|nr:hypothetical protein [Gemmatimonadota bacterium]